MTTHAVDITLENAQSLLIEESYRRPVLVDFWASWCEACKSLMPILDKLAQENDGQFLLARVNADELQMISQQFGVSSLPTVMLIKDGQPVDGFTGLKPEADIRTLLGKYLPKPWDLQFEHAQNHLASGELNEAHTLLREACDASYGQANIVVALAEVKTLLKRFAEAEATLAQVKLANHDAYYEQVRAALELAQQAQKAPELQALEDQLQQSPNDPDTMFLLAIQYSQHDFKAEALALLFTLISRDLNAKDGEAKRNYMDILAVLGKGDPIAAEYQRKLYTLLY